MINNILKISTYIIACFASVVTSSYGAEKITVALDWTINTNHNGLYTALNKGYFKEEGIELKIIPASETSAILMLLSGSVDFIVTTHHEVSIAAAKGKDITAVAAIMQSNTTGYASLKSKGIQSVQDFKGKTFGGYGSPLEKAQLNAILHKSGMSDEDIKFVNLGSVDFFTASKTTSDISTIYYGWTGIEATIQRVPINFIPLKSIDSRLDSYSPIYASSNKFIDSNELLAKKFLKALSKGYVYSTEEPKEASDILLSYAKGLDKDLVLNSSMYLAKTYLDSNGSWGSISKDKWVHFNEFLNEYNLLENPKLADKAFTNKLLN